MNELLKLKDIKPNVPVHTGSSLNIGLILLIISVLLILTIIFLFIRKNLKSKKEKSALFNMIDNPKKFAYEFTKKAKKYKTKKNEELFKKIIARLGEYKYKPTVQNIDKETVKLIKKYLEIK